MKKSNIIKIIWFLRIVAWSFGLIAMGFLLYGILKNLNIL
jgi:hypothetical protein